MSKNKHQKKKTLPPSSQLTHTKPTGTVVTRATVSGNEVVKEVVVGDDDKGAVIAPPKAAPALKLSPTCGLITIDHFYSNPNETREYILTQPFSVMGNYPGQRTVSYATEELKRIFQGYVYPFGGKITEFHIPKPDNSDAAGIYNGAFQYTTQRDRSWMHLDGYNNWAGVLYLTPDAPLSSGTGFYRFRENGMYTKHEMELADKKRDADHWGQDMTKWELVDRVGNIYNRLILFNSHRFHMSMDYFGDSKENGRLFQVFFFSTER